MYIDAYVIPTYKCNLNCKFCFAGDFINTGNEKKWTEADLSLFFEDCFKHNAKYHITLGGGEPLLNPEFISDFVKYIETNSITSNIERCNVVTNGMFLSQVEKIYNAKKYITLNVSLHGFEKSHEFLVGKTGIWRNIVKNMLFLKQQGYKFDVGIVVNRVNLKEVTKLIDFLISVGFFEFHIIFYHYIGNAVKNNKLLFIDFFGDDKGSIEQISEYINLKKTSNITINLVNNFPLCQLGKGGTFDKQMQQAQDNYFFKIRKGYYGKTYKDKDLPKDFFNINSDEFFIGDFLNLTSEILEKTKFLEICHDCNKKDKCNLVLDYIDAVYYQKIYNRTTKFSSYFSEKLIS